MSEVVESRFQERKWLSADNRKDLCNKATYCLRFKAFNLKNIVDLEMLYKLN